MRSAAEHALFARELGKEQRAVVQTKQGKTKKYPEYHPADGCPRGGHDTDSEVYGHYQAGSGGGVAAEIGKIARIAMGRRGQPISGGQMYS